jgi:hypothetical protein
VVDAMNEHSSTTSIFAWLYAGHAAVHSASSIGVCVPPGPFARCGTMHSAAHMPILK